MTTPEFADEVVTNAFVRYLALPGLDGEIALITLDNGKDHTRPSTFGPGGLASLNSALDEIEAHSPGVKAIAVTGKPFIFAVGADLDGVPRLTDREQALAIGRLGHATFARLRDASVPTFAFVNGAAMGGGIEIGLHCDYRTISSGAAALALPEVFLGLVPGWGGTWLLPNLIGAGNAVTVIVENALNQNKMLKPTQYLELGIGDVLFEPADFLERSLEWAAGVLRGDVEVARPEIDRGQAWDDAVAWGRAVADGKVHGASPAPYRALDLIAAARTSTFEDGTAAEDEALADLIMGDELRAGLYSFDLVQKRAKRPVGVPDRKLARPVTKVGVVGAGLMAGQLALLFARKLEVPVVLTDLDQARLDKGVGYVHGEIDKLLSRKRVSPDRANRLKALVTGSLTKDAFADADFVIEAVFEEIGVKQQVFADVEAVVSPSCVLATNTSSLSVTEMASRLQHPERVVGFHFFNPVAVLPLLEIVRAEQTDDASLATAFSVGKSLGKSCVLVKDAPAFVVNRLLTRFLGEVTRAIDEGTDLLEADRALEPLGLPMSPLLLLQLVGPAIALHVSETLHEAYPSRFYVSENMRTVVGAGKTAFLDWSSGSPVVDPAVAEIYGPRTGGPSADEIRERALAALAEEIRLMLDEGVVAAAQDIDLCMILGAGWPFHLGGITPYLDRVGVAEKVTGQRFLAPGVASLPA
ncbi:3-hydroxyacyl-CoA dehydrogenase NAD-binding domain-containing protein [Cryptosporangium arvum]|uniref:3-hydroxyacyl-CoA dehydrogenase n=1 Tax=Cryptosporangium arvum DSM 44712 TaxID=927661 RepID=A0A011AFW8_9ACTN|nr:3-hydroxyacyl-CoA dehydrogenase NAD-binding domain-containing protein [Cryptosporangium arvum]EXG80921.1 3-hydroxyacyl-CoA dehydrogenase [Cryptosporangium arvum DSM 44712]